MLDISLSLMGWVVVLLISWILFHLCRVAYNFIFEPTKPIYSADVICWIWSKKDGKKYHVFVGDKYKFRDKRPLHVNQEYETFFTESWDDHIMGTMLYFLVFLAAAFFWPITLCVIATYGLRWLVRRIKNRRKK